MKKIAKKPYSPFFIAIPIAILIGTFNYNEILDINVHDTYFVIVHFHIYVFIALLLFFLGTCYLIIHNAKRKISKWLTGIHLITTIGGLISLYLISIFPSKNENQSDSPIIDDFLDPNLLITLTILLIIIGQLLFLLNIIIAIFNKKDYS